MLAVYTILNGKKDKHDKNETKGQGEKEGGDEAEGKGGEGEEKGKLERTGKGEIQFQKAQHNRLSFPLDQFCFEVTFNKTFDTSSL